MFTWMGHVHGLHVRQSWTVCAWTVSFPPAIVLAGGSPDGPSSTVHMARAPRRAELLTSGAVESTDALTVEKLQDHLLSSHLSCIHTTACPGGLDKASTTWPNP